MHKSLLDVVANAELLDELTVLIDVVLLDVGEETTTLTDEHEQATTGVEVLLVGLHVLGQLLDALGQDGDLNLGVAGVLGVLAELGGELRLALLGNRHDFTFLVAAAGCGPMASIRPQLGSRRWSGYPSGGYQQVGMLPQTSSTMPQSHNLPMLCSVFEEMSPVGVAPINPGHHRHSPETDGTHGESSGNHP